MLARTRRVYDDGNLTLCLGAGVAIDDNVPVQLEQHNANQYRGCGSRGYEKSKRGRAALPRVVVTGSSGHANAGAAPVAARACPVCGQALTADCGPCPNVVCGSDDRPFASVRAVCAHADEMWRAVVRLKYDEERGWAPILGRILVGFLEEHRADFEDYDLITPSANYVGPGAKRSWDHLRLILEAAQVEGPAWPFAYDLIVKTAPTDRFFGKSPRERSEIAQGPLRAALSVPDPDRVAGRRILVFDDVYSEGFTIREMARALVGAGAAEVSGIVLARRKGG